VKVVVLQQVWTEVEIPDEVLASAVARNTCYQRNEGESLVDYIRRVNPGQNACAEILTYGVDTADTDVCVVTVDGQDIV